MTKLSRVQTRKEKELWRKYKKGKELELQPSTPELSRTQVERKRKIKRNSIVGTTSGVALGIILSVKAFVITPADVEAKWIDKSQIATDKAHFTKKAPYKVTLPLIEEKSIQSTVNDFAIRTKVENKDVLVTLKTVGSEEEKMPKVPSVTELINQDIQTTSPLKSKEKKITAKVKAETIKENSLKTKTIVESNDSKTEPKTVVTSSKSDVEMKTEESRKVESNNMTVTPSESSPKTKPAKINKETTDPMKTAGAISENPEKGMSTAVELVLTELEKQGRPVDSEQHIVVDHTENGYDIVQYYKVLNDGGVPHTSTIAWFAVDVKNKQVYDITYDISILNISNNNELKSESETHMDSQMVKEAIGKVVSISDLYITIDVKGKTISYSSKGNKSVQEELKGIENGDGIVVRYVDNNDGTKALKDVVLINKQQQGNLSKFITADYFEMKDGNLLTVFENNKEITYKLSPALIGRDLDSDFAPGTKVILALVKTEVGYIVENISEQQ